MNPLPPSLPAPDAASLAHAAQVHAHLQEQIRAAGGWLAFDRFMAAALYAPGLGYYAAGNQKLGSPDDAHPAGDFVTAPELTPLFAATLARQVGQVLEACGSAEVLEFGAGTGALAERLLVELEAMGIRADYRILEVSADLRRASKPGWRASATGSGGWTACRRLSGAAWSATKCWTRCRCACSAGAKRRWQERGVVLADDGCFAWSDRPAPADLRGRGVGAHAGLAGRTCRKSICRPKPSCAAWGSGWPPGRRC